MTTVKSVTTIEGNFFFLSGFSFTDTYNSQDSSGREGTIFYSTLPFPPAHKYSDIYLQLWMWDDYQVFVITRLVFARLLLDEIYHLIESPFDWLIDWLIDDAMFVCLLDKLILDFCYSVFDMGQLWIWTCIDYHPCITSEPTNQVYIEGIETMFCLWSFLIFFTKQPMTKRLQKY